VQAKVKPDACVDAKINELEEILSVTIINRINELINGIDPVIDRLTTIKTIINRINELKESKHSV